MYSVYVLYSASSDLHYTGFTSDLNSRFESHNDLATKGWTVKHRPWKLIHVENYNRKADAMAREKYLKSGAGRDYIKTLKH
jgi:putative endonuclease